MNFRRLAVTLIFPLSLVAVTLAFASDISTTFNGYELFPGVRKQISRRSVSCDDTSFTADTKTVGTSFAALTPEGGVVGASVNYLGSPGLGQEGKTNTVCIRGGTWSWQQFFVTYYGNVEKGEKSFVTWPPSGETLTPNPNNCGTNVAEFTASVSVSNAHGTGTITGCLNDQNNLVPPPISGTITLTLE